jgi:hypothetical protein
MSLGHGVRQCYISSMPGLSSPQHHKIHEYTHRRTCTRWWGNVLSQEVRWRRKATPGGRAFYPWKHTKLDTLRLPVQCSPAFSSLVTISKVSPRLKARLPLIRILFSISRAPPCRPSLPRTHRSFHRSIALFPSQPAYHYHISLSHACPVSLPVVEVPT